MIGGDLFGRISSFVEAHLLETGREHVGSLMGPKYCFEHSLRVAFWCWRIALETHADVSTCVSAGLLHDVSHFESRNPKEQATKSATIAREFMAKEKFKKDFIDTVADAIESLAKEAMPRTLEAKILQDADKMDEFSSIKLLLFTKDSEIQKFQNLRERAKSLLPEVEKIAKDDYSQVWTNMGKAKIKAQITMYKTFLNGLLEEIENTETTMT